MDGLSVAGSILPLMAAARQVWTLFVDAKSFDKDIQNHGAEVKRLSYELDDIDRFFRAQAQAGIEPNGVEQSEDLGLLSQFKEILTRMDSVLNEVGCGQGIASKPKRFLKWAKGKESFNGHSEDIRSIRESLHTKLLILLK